MGYCVTLEETCAFYTNRGKLFVLILVFTTKPVSSADPYQHPCLDKTACNLITTEWLGEDPCKPLYWYPRHIPEFCYKKPTPPVQPPPIIFPPEPVPVLVPLPVPPPVPLPYGIPIIPTHPMVPVQGSYVSPFFQPPVFPPFPPPPPLPAPFISPFGPSVFGPRPDTGINVLPGSTVYGDVLEKMRQKKMLDNWELLLRRRGMIKKGDLFDDDD